MSTIRMLLPILPKDDKETFFKGHVNSEPELTTLFITTFSSNKEVLQDDGKNHNNVLFGLKGERRKKFRGRTCLNYFVLKQESDIQIHQLVINGKDLQIEHSKIIVILYDYHDILNSETLSAPDDYFLKLQSLIQKDCHKSMTITQYKPVFINPPWLSSSMFVQHVFNFLNILNWLLGTFKRKQKISIKQGNLMLSILIDIVLGYLILQLIVIDNKELGNILLGMLEKLVNLMYSLLKWLMGAPAGLKLNNAFNKMLGKYFSYHVELWWLFLDVTSEKLDIILHIYQYVGYLGLTFQAAMISDMICLATFHSYCIYVYAARLFNIQMSGLTALLRLFVGRKYNPLRGGIDSCEYTNQELFVGTVAFTILLLLLPTTLMYYIVFTMFRVLSLLLQYILAKLIYVVHTLPLYVVTLRLSRSSKVAGNILIKVIKSEEGSPLILRVKLFNKSFQDLIKFSKPPIEETKQLEWTQIVSNVFTGSQII